LANRDANAMARYLPKMEKACDFIERTRDPQNNLFLVGPACNLLAPSYGGVKQPDGTFGKGYLAGLSITYLAAMDRMVELYRITGDKVKLAEYERRQKITRESLPQLLTPAGYFVKSIEPGGMKHGVLGQAKYGYLEGVANADAVALRVADQARAEAIYRQIAAFPAIRPFDWLLTNAPGLDDTYWLWGASEPLPDMHAFGHWVNGAAWKVESPHEVVLPYETLPKAAKIEKCDNIVKFYEDAALAMYRGFAKRMSGYENSPDTAKKRLGGLFQQVVPVPERAVTLPKGGQSKDADANAAWGGAPIDNGPIY
jgi:hypothetical protein